MSGFADSVISAVGRVAAVTIRIASWAHRWSLAAWEGLAGRLGRIRLLATGRVPEGDAAGSWTRTLRVGGAAAAVMALCAVAFWRRSVQLGVADVGVPDSRLWYSASDLALFFACIKGPGRLLYGLTQLSLDVLFPIAYATLLTVLIERIWRGREESIGRLWVTPLLAAGFDLLENVILAALALSGTTTPSETLVGIAAGCTLLKWLSAVVSILLLGRVLLVEQPPWVHRLGLVWWALVLYVLVTWPTAAFLGVLLLAVVAQRKLFLWQYLFFLRFVLIVALGLLFMPSAARQFSDGRLFSNLFVLESWRAVPSWVFVLFPGFFLGMLTMSLLWATQMVLTIVPHRYKLPLVQEDRNRLPKPERDQPEEAPGPEPDWPKKAEKAQPGELVNPNLERLEKPPGSNVRRLAPGLAALLAAPFAIEIWRSSGWALWEKPWTALPPLLAFAGGFVPWVALELCLREQWPRLGTSLAKRAAERLRAHGGTVQGLADRRTTPFRGFGADDLPTLLFVFVVAAAYLIVGAFLNPGSGRFWDRIPAVSFVLLIAVVVVWVMTVVALVLDVWRVPVLITLLAAVFVAHRAANYDHYFDVVARPSPELRLPTPGQALAQWRARNTSDFVTVVAASGGGIKASLWTARVLQELVRKGLGPSILLLSTNSGGSLGGMYFTDSYAGGLPPSEKKMADVVRLAGSSSLSACAWGMAYPDLWHLFLGGYPPFQSPTHDRGWAMDRRWEWRRGRLAGDARGQHRRLGDWAIDVEQGLRPAHIFNATVVESGAAFRLSSVALGRAWPTSAPGSKPHEFWEFYGAARADIEVATAARLSASFPWVSPMARAWADPRLDGQVDAGLVNSVEAFRLADGGYFDNFGIYSAIQFLEQIGPEALYDDGVKRVLFVQIRATPEGSARATRGGIQYSLFGPVLAMNSVLNSSQVARNDLDVGLLKELWARHANPVEVIPVEFDLRSPGPLSWHLTQHDGEAVLEGFNQCQRDRLDRALESLGRDVANRPPAPGVEPAPCEAEDAGGSKGE